MRELSLDQLRTLVAVTELGSFSAAARALHLAQPTVSLHVSELEARLATLLLFRGGRRVTPTGAGEVLVARARQLLRDANEAVELVKRHREGQVARVRLGSSSGAMVHLLPQILERLDAELPNIDVQVTVGRSAELMNKLFVGDVDLALVATPQAVFPGLKVTPWRHTPMVAMLPARWEAPKAVTPQWLASRPLIFNEPTTQVHQQTMAWFGAAGLHPTARIEMQFNEVTRRLVAAGYGAAILPFEDPSEALEGRIQIVRLRPALTRQLAVAHRAVGPLDEATCRVMRVVVGFRELRGG
ncbi:LysR family transcriptional regulator [Aquabacterium sp. A7-Y]|uniref:LysR family transcriptional regulator n=1 Tax=Aquabacterium sp. A7-Y TaxID=1349605 RepID=UPI00223CD8B5|nr:LysR family transcriptional regulator [Aquabacterium sp. A7-Y]MCW7541259.1 LysR family transcriptional regulator [Aquabacterium sp. A7-Y]